MGYIRQCDTFYEWFTNSGNSDAHCHDHVSSKGTLILRNSDTCINCPYNELIMGDK